ncbi:MAG: RimJ/RimL family protein N-acetyltransferase [Planctomycetota bacterium]|jgi:RimJ/RimL family protein N-acetyltransferase
MIPAALFETERLACRQLSADDYDQLMAVYGDAQAMGWVGDGLVLTPEDGGRWIEVTHANYEQRGYGMSVISLRSTGQVLGFCGLVHPGGQPDVEVKYAFHRSTWGQGIATEAVRGMLDYGRGHHAMQEIIATVHPDNLASQRVLTKVGMRLAETIKQEDGSSTLLFRTGS